MLSGGHRYRTQYLTRYFDLQPSWFMHELLCKCKNCLHLQREWRMGTRTCVLWSPETFRGNMSWLSLQEVLSGCRQIHQHPSYTWSCPLHLFQVQTSFHLWFYWQNINQRWVKQSTQTLSIKQDSINKTRMDTSILTQYHVPAQIRTCKLLWLGELMLSGTSLQHETKLQILLKAVCSAA